MKEKILHTIVVLVIIAIIAIGITLINIGDTPLFIQLIHFVGFLLFFIGMGLAIIALFIVIINIHDYFNPSNQEGQRN